MEDMGRIMRNAKSEMREMLYSVYNYNSSFPLSSEQEKLLSKILFAMAVIDRKLFYSGIEVYEDIALPIGEGQTISQPSTVARMLLLSNLKQGDEFLEIGTGSGWNSCLAAFLVYPGSVVSLERIYKLTEQAKQNLDDLRENLKKKRPEIYEKLMKIDFLVENIFEKKASWKKNYDKIIITAGIREFQEDRVEEIAGQLLKAGGKLICPHISGSLIIYDKKEKLIKSETEEQYVFVSLVE